MKKISVDNPFFNWMGTIGDFILLNIVFLLTCIPVVTIGVSLTSLYRVMIKRLQGESAYPVKEYFRMIRKEWKQSTVLWLILLVSGGVLAFDIFFARNMPRALNICIGVLALLWGFVCTYTFLLQGQYQNTVGNTLKNALLLSIANLHFTIPMLLVNAIPAICIVLGDFVIAMIVPVYVVVGFSLTAWVNSFLLMRIFKKI